MKKRCFGNQVEILCNYHDNEWGRISNDDKYLFEMLILEGAQAGLNWEAILKKRHNYRKLFYNFDYNFVAIMDDNILEKLCKNSDIIRNRLKIYSARKNAQIFLKIRAEFGSFNKYIWGFVNNCPIINNWKKIEDVPSSTELSNQISKDLKKRGMSFVGPTIIYSYMQAIGIVNDHLLDCWLRDS